MALPSRLEIEKLNAWRSDALCGEMDPEIWFPDTHQQASVAKQVCRRCPVRQECLVDALATNERHGVRGGRSVNERRNIAFSPPEKHALCGTDAGVRHHYRQRQQLCAACAQQNLASQYGRRTMLPHVAQKAEPTDTGKCGTDTGARVHRSRSEKLCAACQTAADEASVARRHRYKP